MLKIDVIRFEAQDVITTSVPVAEEQAPVTEEKAPEDTNNEITNNDGDNGEGGGDGGDGDKGHDELPPAEP